MNEDIIYFIKKVKRTISYQKLKIHKNSFKFWEKTKIYLSQFPEKKPKNTDYIRLILSYT